MSSYAVCPRPRHILQLSTSEKREFLDSFDCVFSDIDGVVWNVNQIISGAPECMEEIKTIGKRLIFITNNSFRSESQCVRKFEKLNMAVDAENIVHPVKTMVQYLRSISFDGLIYIIASDNFKKVLREAGYKLIDGPQTILDESDLDISAYVFDREPVRAVIVDHDYNLSYIKLLRAQTYLRHPECLLIAGATDILMPVRKDCKILGPGAFSKLLCEVSGKPIITMGKPSKDLGRMLHRQYNIDQSKRALMIGDMLEQDVRFGKESGFQTLLVLSGGCSLSELEAEKNPELIPDYYADSVADLLRLVMDVRKSNA